MTGSPEAIKATMSGLKRWLEPLHWTAKRLTSYMHQLTRRLLGTESYTVRRKAGQKSQVQHSSTLLQERWFFGGGCLVNVAFVGRVRVLMVLHAK
jgi:hypothetical protein